MTAALDAIRDLAEAATPGPWYIERDGWVRVKLEDGLRVTVCSTADDRYLLERSKPDAAYIAAVDPQTVLALLAALDRAEAVVGALRDFDGEMGHSWRCEYRTEESGWKPGEPPVIHCECGYDEIGQALRAYEDADKVADHGD